MTRGPPPNSGWISCVDAHWLAYQRLGTLRAANDVLRENDHWLHRRWVPADPALDPRILNPRDKVEAILPVELRGDVEVFSPNRRFEMEYRINGKPEAGELFYREKEVRAFLDWPPEDRFSPTGVVRKAIESGDLKQKAEEAPPVSPEPATPNDKPASAPATGAEVLAEFPVGAEQAQSVMKPAKPKPERIPRSRPNARR